MKVSDIKFSDIVKSSPSIRQILIKLGNAPKGGNYLTVKNRIKKLNLDTSHFKGQGWNLGMQLPVKIPISDYLSNKKPIQSYKLRNRLLREGLLERKCYQCNITTWNGKPLSIELHHIDGNTSNNSLYNLELLCPNCHSQTPNHRRCKASLKA